MAFNGESVLSVDNRLIIIEKAWQAYKKNFSLAQKFYIKYICNKKMRVFIVKIEFIPILYGLPECRSPKWPKIPVFDEPLATPHKSKQKNNRQL